MNNTNDTIPWNETGLIFLNNTFHYIPNNTAAIICTSVFGFLSVVSLFTTIYWNHRAKYMHIVTITAALEAVGYGTRYVAATQYNLSAFIVSLLLILICPIALAYLDYYALGKVLQKVGRSVYNLKPHSISRLFLCSDIVTLILQAVGGSMLAVNKGNYTQAGIAITLASLSVQLIFFACFTWITIRVAIGSGWKLWSLPSLKLVFTGLWLTITLLFARNIYRLAEFASGRYGYLQTNEWPTYIFEFLPIFTCSTVFILLHFGRLLPDGGFWVQDIREHKYSKKEVPLEEIKKGDGIPTNEVKD